MKTISKFLAVLVVAGLGFSGNANAEGLAELGITPTPAEIILPSYLERYRAQRNQTPRLV